MSKSKPRPRHKGEKYPFLSIAYWYDAAFGPSRPRPPKKPKKWMAPCAPKSVRPGLRSRVGWRRTAEGASKVAPQEFTPAGAAQ